MNGRNLHAPPLVLSFINAAVKELNLPVVLKDAIRGGTGRGRSRVEKRKAGRGAAWEEGNDTGPGNIRRKGSTKKDAVEPESCERGCERAGQDGVKGRTYVYKKKWT